MAGYISRETISAVLNTTDIVSVIGEYTKLEQRAPGDWWGCCPFHGEKTASFHVDVGHKLYYCFGCHEGGNIINFFMEMEKYSYVDAILALAKRSGIPVKYQNGQLPSKEEQFKSNEIEEYTQLYERLTSMFHYILVQCEDGVEALKYIKERGVSDAMIEKFKLGYSPSDRYWLKNFLKSKNYSDKFLANSGLFSKNYPDISFFNDRLMFPIFNRQGRAVAFGGRILHPKGDKDRKYMNSGDLVQYKKRETLFAFNFAKNAIREHKAVIFCEGYMDCVAYHQSGIEYAVAPLGTALTEEQIKMVRSFVDVVLLSFDSDNAGQNATLRAIYMCRKFNLTVKIIRLKGGKDPSEILNKFGKENLTTQVNNAILDNDYILFRLGEKYPLGTPEGKAKAAMEYFDYVDVLQSDIQKESCLELFSQTFNLNPEAVERDFKSHRQGQFRTNIRQNTNQTNQDTQIVLDAELRGLMAVAANFDLFRSVREELSESDFQNPAARDLFKSLEVSFEQNLVTVNEIVDNCEDAVLKNLLTGAVASGIYNGESGRLIAKDSMNFVMRNKLEDERCRLIHRIANYNIVTEDDQKQFDQLLVDKMNLDKRVQNLGK